VLHEPSTTYLPGQIHSFEFLHGDAYVSRNTTLHYYTDVVSELERQMDTLTTAGSFFLRVLFTGKASLYLLEDAKFHKHFFIEKEGMQTDELVLKRSIATQKDKSQMTQDVAAIVTIDKYKQLLSYYFSDCPDIVSRIRKTEFTEKDLIALFDDYNACVSSKGTVRTAKQDKFHWGPVLGLAATTLSFSSDLPQYKFLEEASYSTSFDFVAGLRLEFVLPRNKGRYSVVSDVLYIPYYVTSAYQQNQWMVTSVFDFSYLRIHSQFQFDLTSQELRPFLKAGIGYNIALKQDSYEVRQSGQALPVMYTTVDNTRSYEWSALLSTGLKYKRYRFDIGVELGNGFIYDFGGSLHSETLSFQSLFAYLI
jgi:hypothetical protein